MLSRISKVLVLAVMIPVLTAAENAAIKVKPVSITEVRHKDLATQQHHQFNTFNQPNQPGLTIAIELSGEEISQASQYGQIEIKSAKNDIGDTVKQNETVSYMGKDYSKEFVNIDRGMMNMGFQEQPNDKLKIDLQFEPVSRSSKAIAFVEGSLKLRVGKPKPIIINNINKMVDKTIEDPNLKAASLTIKVLKVTPNKSQFFGSTDPDRAISFEIKGNVANLISIELVDEMGEKLNSSEMSSSSTFPSGEILTKVLETDEKLPLSAKLKIVTIVGLKTIDVPFKLENIPLP